MLILQLFLWNLLHSHNSFSPGRNCQAQPSDRSPLCNFASPRAQSIWFVEQYSATILDSQYMCFNYVICQRPRLAKVHHVHHDAPNDKYLRGKQMFLFPFIIIYIYSSFLILRHSTGTRVFFFFWLLVMVPMWRRRQRRSRWQKRWCVLGRSEHCTWCTRYTRAKIKSDEQILWLSQRPRLIEVCAWRLSTGTLLSQYKRYIR